MCKESGENNSVRHDDVEEKDPLLPTNCSWSVLLTGVCSLSPATTAVPKLPAACSNLDTFSFLVVGRHGKIMVDHHDQKACTNTSEQELLLQNCTRV